MGWFKALFLLFYVGVTDLRPNAHVLPSLIAARPLQRFWLCTQVFLIFISSKWTTSAGAKSPKEEEKSVASIAAVMLLISSHTEHYMLFVVFAEEMI